MKRKYLVLLCGLALVGALAGCSKKNAPDVTPTPSAATPSESVRPSETVKPTDTTAPTDTVSPTDNYHADGDGRVEDDTTGQGDHSLGDGIQDAIDDAGDVVRDAAEGTGRTIEKIGDDLTGNR